MKVRKNVAFSMPNTISLGVSSFPEDAENFNEFVNKADAALYEAKENGRNRVYLAE